MHYIRFLKSPRIVGKGNEKALGAKITISTDLGESFLAADLGICVDVVEEDGESILGPGREYVWKGREGMRSLEVSVPMRKVRKVRMVVAAKGEAYVGSFESVLGIGERKGGILGGVVTVRSMEIDGYTGYPIATGLSERVFSSSIRNDLTEIHIWEETGESIARHVWDAGLVLSSYIASLPHITNSPLPRLPILESTLSSPSLKILELGAGCGIVGITILHTLPSPTRILLTDLPEATEILSCNTSPPVLGLSPSSASKISHQVLDWSLPLPSNVAATKWDIVFVADCTYNPDVVPDLVKTLARLADGNRDVKVVVAMKVRHESELVFFDLVKERGFVVNEKGILPLPVLGGEDQEIEVFVFGCSSEAAQKVG